MDIALDGRPIDAALMRGGTSRGPVLRADDLPQEPEARDAAVVRLVGGEAVQTDGVGGGSPTTSKLVVVRPGRDERGLLIDYAVGNIVVGRNAVDWSGTCGNMTATVPLYALEENLLEPSSEGAIRLRNLSTGGRIDTFLGDVHDHHQRGREVRVTTRYLEPTGSVLGALLPTGAGTDTIGLEGRTYRVSLVDVTHPYLFMLYDEVVGDGDVRSAEVLERIERLRGEICVRLGLVVSSADAARLSAAVPRAVLVHRDEQTDGTLRISAVSMGQPIATVPVTAAMCLAAATRIPSTLLARNAGADSGAAELTVVASGARLRASAAAGADGRIVSVAVERTARTIMWGRAWI